MRLRRALNAATVTRESLMKKPIAIGIFLAAIAVAAFAEPPELICHRYCAPAGPVNSAPYKACMEECLAVL